MRLPQDARAQTVLFGGSSWVLGEEVFDEEICISGRRSAPAPCWAACNAHRMSLPCMCSGASSMWTLVTHARLAAEWYGVPVALCGSASRWTPPCYRCCFQPLDFVPRSQVEPPLEWPPTSANPEEVKMLTMESHCRLVRAVSSGELERGLSLLK